MNRPKKIIVGLLSVVLAASTITGCGMVAFSKDGESDAISACTALTVLNDDDVSREEVLNALAKAADISLAAADANDDYELLHSGIVALLEVVLLGSSLDVAKVTYANVANLCNEL